jgi:hypothetical protein
VSRLKWVPNSPKASFCFEVPEKIIGVIAVPEQDTGSKIMQATASFAHKTQPILSEELVLNVLNRLPYNPPSNPPTQRY